MNTEFDKIADNNKDLDAKVNENRQSFDPLISKSSTMV